MKRIFALAALPLVVALVPKNPPSGLEASVAAMQAAASFNVNYTVTEVGGIVEERSLSLGRPGMLRLETPTTLTICDGKLVTTYNKAKKTYSQVPQTETWSKAIFSQDTIWIWSAFFDANLAKQVTSSKPGTTRNVKGVQLAEWTFGREKGPITLFFDKKTNLARGGTFKTEKGVDVIVQATMIDASKNDPDASLFAWTAPAGATAVVPEDPSKVLTYADIRPILENNCGRCHISDSKGGVSLGTYAQVMSGRLVGKTSAESKLIRVIRSGVMPPRGGRVPAEDVDKLAKWIDDGAKE